MKKLFLPLALLLLLSGCASWTQHTPPKYINKESYSYKMAEQSSRVWFGIFGKRTYPLVADVAIAGGITKITTIEYSVKRGIISWVYTTTITGE
jgi:uncharacterized protein YceK